MVVEIMNDWLRDKKIQDKRAFPRVKNNDEFDFPSEFYQNFGLQTKEYWCLCSASSKTPDKKTSNQIKQGENGQRNKLQDSGHKRINQQNLIDKEESKHLNF